MSEPQPTSESYEESTHREPADLKAVPISAETSSRSRSRRDDDDAIRVTDAAPSHSDDLDRRMGQYLGLMAIRVVCFVLAIVIHSWVRWLLVAGALILPYVAVVLVNARATGSAEPPKFFTPHRRSLSSGNTK